MTWKMKDPSKSKTPPRDFQAINKICLTNKLIDSKVDFINKITIYS